MRLAGMRLQERLNMKHKGKLPQAAVGEILHVVNNKLGFIMFVASKIEGKEGERAQEVVIEIANYLRSLETKEEFNSNPFEDENKKAA